VREHFHSNHILEPVSLYDPTTQERLQAMTGYFAGLGADPELAQLQALTAIAGIARRDSYVMAFNDAFFVIGSAFVFSLFVILFLKKAPTAGAAHGE
jgi:DHA2 family multidrug resistance protein